MVFDFNWVKAWLVSWQTERLVRHWLVWEQLRHKELGLEFTGKEAHLCGKKQSCDNNIERISKLKLNNEQHCLWITGRFVWSLCLTVSQQSFLVVLSVTFCSKSLCMVKHSSASRCLIDCVYIRGDRFRYCVIRLQWQEINYILCFYCTAEPPVP